MTVKLSKTVITGFDIDGVENIGVNANLRMTMGHDNGSINIKVDKIKREEMVRDETTPVTYETIFEKTITAADFPMDVDHKAWYVEYDVIKNDIVILDLLKFGADNKYRTENYHGTNLHRDVKMRYNENYLPLVYIKTFDKSANGFDSSLINFYLQDTPGESSDTIITNEDAQLMTTQERQAWVNSNLTSYFTFTIKSEDGSQTINVPQTRLYTVDGQGQNVRSNKYKVNLPAAKYTIQVDVEKGLYPNLENTYDIRVLNGFINKTRVITGAGSFTVKLDLSELETADFAKLKFDIGQFLSYAELWIDIV